jgi:hypothetical protein
VEPVDQCVAKPIHVSKLRSLVALAQVLFVREGHEVQWGVEAYGHTSGDRVAEDVLSIVRELQEPQ